MDYSPFGQLIAQYKFTSNATLSRLNFGFSTKFTDTETGLLYYGYRFYDPVTGRWPSRDPIGEGAIIDFNLYAFTGNRSPSRIDFLGLRTEIGWEDYWRQFQEKYPGISPQQRRWAENTLSLGCKGVTGVCLGDMPRNMACFKTKELAEDKQRELNRKNPSCCAQIYSIHFWNDGKDTDSPEVTFSRDGKADMRNWDESSQKEGLIPFDFGFLNPDGTITHANHGYNPEDPKNKGKGKYRKDWPLTDTNDENKSLIYISTLEEWKESYPNFNEEVWCAQCISNKSGVKK